MRLHANHSFLLATLASLTLGSACKADATPAGDNQSATTTAKDNDGQVPPVLKYFRMVSKGDHAAADTIVEKSADGLFMAFKDKNNPVARDRDNIIELKLWNTADGAVLAMHEYRSYGSTATPTFWRFKGEKNQTVGGVQLEDMIANFDAFQGWQNERMSRTQLACCTLFALLPKAGDTMEVVQVPGDTSGSIKARPTTLKKGGELKLEGDRFVFVPAPE